MSGPPANGRLVRLAAPPAARATTILQINVKEGSAGPLLKYKAPSLTRAGQMEQMTGTNGAYIGVTATHSRTHSHRRTVERAAVAPTPLP